MAKCIHYKGYSARINYDVYTGVFYGTVYSVSEIPICFKGNSLREMEGVFEKIIENCMTTKPESKNDNNIERKDLEL